MKRLHCSMLLATLFVGTTTVAPAQAITQTKSEKTHKTENEQNANPIEFSKLDDPWACDADASCDDFQFSPNRFNSCDSRSLFGRPFGGFATGLLSNLRKSDHCFDDFISPMINPIFFEDPRTLTELRPIYLRQETPNRIGDMGLQGGRAQVFAAQFRIALTERLSLIATKDGYLVSDIDGPLGDMLDDGWADVSAGLKYNLLRNPETGTLWSVGGVYEIPLGSKRSLQAVGDGEFNIFTSFGQRLYDGRAHWLSSFGYRFPVDDAVQTSSIHWSNQFDVRVTKSIYLLTGVAWWHWVDDAETGLPLGIGGGDFFNLPSTNVAGRDFVTQNVGAKYKPNRNFEAGLAYEFPLTNNQDLMDNRVHLDIIFRY